MTAKLSFWHYMARADQVAYVTIAEHQPDDDGNRLCRVHFSCGHHLDAAVVAFDGVWMIIASVAPWEHQCRGCILTYYGGDDES